MWSTHLAFTDSHWSLLKVGKNNDITFDAKNKNPSIHFQVARGGMIPRPYDYELSILYFLCIPQFSFVFIFRILSLLVFFIHPSFYLKPNNKPCTN